MKKTAKSVITGLILTAAVALPQLSFAAVIDVSHPTKALTLIDNTLNFGAKFGNGLKNGVFDDRFSFSFNSTGSAEAIVSSISSSASNGLDLTGFDIINTHGVVVAQGVQQSTGTRDVWVIPSKSLFNGNYLLRVQGIVMSNTSASFGGNLNVTPVPEAETYAMMLLGLGVLAAVARRRKSAELN